MFCLMLWACAGDAPTETGDRDTRDTGVPEQDSGLVTLWWVGDATLDGDDLAGTSWWTATGWPSERTRCVWQQGWTSATPATDCESCEHAFELVLDIPSTYDGEHCDAGDTLLYSTGTFELAEIVAAGTWREGLGVSTTSTNLLHERYGWGDGDVWYAYAGTWYVAYWAYAVVEDGAFAWSEYWGRGYYYED